MKPATLLQPDYFDAFHCINSACEDTCCAGWIVHVDKLTYGKYQNCSSPELGPALRALITINEKSSSDEDYARIVPDESGCLFLSGGLCSIQLQLGELALSNMCATYPRVINRAGDVLQRSLDLSCPEAARLVLLNPNPMEFREHAWHDGANRPAEYPALDLTGLSGEPYLRYRSVKRRMLAVLQSRLHPVWRRLHVLGSFCEKLASGCSVNDLREDEIQDLEGPQPGV
jgi:lysine-N-methylase